MIRMAQTNPFYGDTLTDMPLRLYRTPPGDQLNQQHPEGVDITLRSELVCVEILRVKVTCCPFNLSRDMGCVGRSQLGESKVGNLRTVIVHEKNVGGFDVPVDDRLICMGAIYGSGYSC